MYQSLCHCHPVGSCSQKIPHLLISFVPPTWLILSIFHLYLQDVITSQELVQKLSHCYQELANLRDKFECEANAKKSLEERLFQKQEEVKHWQMQHQYQLMANEKSEEDLEELESYCQYLEDEREEVHDELSQMKKNLQQGWLYSCS